MKIAAKLADSLLAIAPDERVHIIIKSRLLEKDIVDELTRKPKLSVRHIIKMVNAISASLPAGDVEAFVREPWVERIEEDEKVYAVLDESLPLVKVPQAWDSGLTGKGVKIAIIDTGIDISHPDFTGRILATQDFTLEGFRDSNGHGSLVAGIAAGSGSYSSAKFKGVAPGALILAGKVLTADGSGRMSDVMAAVEWSVDLAADIINLSLGASGSSDGGDALCEICDRAVESGTVVCVAAGNDGPNRRTVGSPAAARRVITVGAATANGLVAEFSSRGPTSDDRLKPEIIAPGIDIISARAKDTRAGKPLDNYYTSATGTSMATPHVAGIIALLLEAGRESSPQLMREALLNTATDLELDDYAQGAGMVDADLALRYVQTHENPPEPNEQAPPRSASLSALAQLYESVVHRNRGERRRNSGQFEPIDDEREGHIEF
ncbi:MAG: hypothetical protein A2074_01510 [Candidatus Aquicultor primus]|uniref:Peptidase S8/S53 domain-containing protein n=1 Tax=Candidatus Aquicultor primus TaxID=1797195 RepID=A0A1F2UVR2_9ACTN|nr:MAG: hypothetical protein A2074_01510 [Candidatus Aquicultor primus]